MNLLRVAPAIQDILLNFVIQFGYINLKQNINQTIQLRVTKLDSLRQVIVNHMVFSPVVTIC